MAGHHLPPSIVLVLEEVDRLRDPAQVFQSLDRINEETSGTAGVIMLSSCLPNHSLPESVRDECFVIRFDGYEQSEIVEILSDHFTERESQGVEAVQQSALQRIAAAAVDRGSDCRFGIRVMEQAIQLAAGDSEFDLVHEDHVEVVLDDLNSPT